MPFDAPGLIGRLLFGVAVADILAGLLADDRASLCDDIADGDVVDSKHGSRRNTRPLCPRRRRLSARGT